MTDLEELCAEFTRAESGCFAAWCAAADGRRAPGPADVIASQAPLHEAAVRLRDRSLAGPAAAEAMRQELMVRQAGAEGAARAAARMDRGAQGRQRIRGELNTTRWSLICQRDALTCGLGWPHRGELVRVSARCATAGEWAQVEADGLYLHSCDVFNAMHAVWVPGRGGPGGQGTVRVDWRPNGQGGHIGPADPAGDIGLRLLEMPALRLPVPLERWPGHVGGPDPAAPRYAQPALFGVQRVSGAFRPGARTAARRQGCHGAAGDSQPALF